MGAVVAGTAVLAVRTGGLIGLAGAAVAAGVLASFGAGGMIGGLITASALADGRGLLNGSQSGSIAMGLSGAETSAEEFEGVVSLPLGAVMLRQRQNLENDPAVWHFLVNVETIVNRLHERLDEISDTKAPTVKVLARKRIVVKRALQYMIENGLEPGGSATARAESDDDQKLGKKFESPFQRTR